MKRRLLGRHLTQGGGRELGDEAGSLHSYVSVDLSSEHQGDAQLRICMLEDPVQGSPDFEFCLHPFLCGPE